MLLTSAGQLCLKAGALRAKAAYSSLFHPWTLSGYSLFVINTILAVYAMQTIDLKIGSTWSAAAFPLVALLAQKVFAEQLTRQQLVGCALITFGIAIFHWPP